jgi:glycosyltransferase involved in cell wall biosynthesis
MNAYSIRIAIVSCSDFKGDPPGGVPKVIESFLRHARERDFDVWLFGLTTSPEEPVGRVSQRQIYGRNYPFVPLLGFDAERYANRRPLIPIRIQMLMAYVCRRRLVESMNFDLLYLHEPEALPLLWNKRQRVLYHIHGTQESLAEYSRYPIFKTRLFSSFYRMWVDSIMKRADEFIAIDQESYDLYTRRMPERKENFHRLPGETDVEQFRPLPCFDRREGRSRFKLPPDGKMVLYVGRLSWKKGVDLVLRAFSLVVSRAPDAYLAIAGEGEDRQELAALVLELGLGEKVRFLGQVPHLPAPDLPILFNCADVSVVASFHEAFALVITEALASGTPLVSTPVGIAPKVVRNGVTGYILESRDPTEMAGRILQIILDGECDRSACAASAQDYGDTSKGICDVVEMLCRQGISSARKPSGISIRSHN